MTAPNVVVRWNGGERTFEPGTVVLIGRETTASVRLNDDRVSRRHAELRSDDNGWTLVDLGSTGGSFVGGSRVSELVLPAWVSVTFGGSSSTEVVQFELVEALGFPAPAPTEMVAPQQLEPTFVRNDMPSRPGGALATNAALGSTEIADNSLSVQFSGRSITLHPGQIARLGREPDDELPTDNPTVSRQHGRIAFAENSWWVEDVGSTRGTFLDGRRIQREKVQGSMAFWLGPPEAGERLVVVASGTTQQSLTKRLRNPRTTAMLAGAACLVAILALVSVLAFRDEKPSRVDVEARLRAASVLIEMSYGTGSGSIIDGRVGLILTNAHVAAPTAPGQGVRYPAEAFRLPEPDDEVLISLATQSDEPAEPRYYGRVVAADGYLDLAVVQITRTIGGHIIEPGENLGLPSIAIGDSRTIDQDQDLIVMGYPGIAETRSPTKSGGSVSSFIPDERIGENRAWLNSDAEIAGGNSGGIAADQQGRLIAVPTAELGSDVDSISKLRPVHLAEALIAAARSGEEYVSPFVVPADNEEIDNVELATVGEEFSTSCAGRRAGTLTSDNAFSLAFDYQGFPDGHQDVLVTVVVNGQLAGRASSADSWPISWGGSGCGAVSVRLRNPLQAGDEVVIFIDAGPNFERPLFETTFNLS